MFRVQELVSPCPPTPWRADPHHRPRLPELRELRPARGGGGVDGRARRSTRIWPVRTRCSWSSTRTDGTCGPAGRRCPTGGYLVHYPGLADFRIRPDGRGSTSSPHAGWPTAPGATSSSTRWSRTSRPSTATRPPLQRRGRPGPGRRPHRPERGREVEPRRRLRADGATLLCDDYLLLRGRRRDLPGHRRLPGLRLWGDSADFFSGGGSRLPPVADFSDKRRLPTARTSPEPMPLGAAIVLGRRRRSRARSAPSSRSTNHGLHRDVPPGIPPGAGRTGRRSRTSTGSAGSRRPYRSSAWSTGAPMTRCPRCSTTMRRPTLDALG